MIYLLSMDLLPKKSKIGGQVLLELLISLAIFAILGHALFTLGATSLNIITYSRARVAAKHIALEKIETIRNLPYDSIGTLGGIPHGNLPQTENIERNGLVYQVITSIVYIDDPYDQLAPADLLPTDYKRVRIDVSWEGLSSSSRSPITLITDISPKGIETTAGGGTLSILVFDSNAIPISQASVNITTIGITPEVNLTLMTNEFGRVILPGAPVCSNNCYQIQVTKDGFSSEKTYSVDEVTNPNKPNASVLLGNITEISFAIDKLGSLTTNSFSSREEGFETLANINYSIRSEKTIGTDAQDQPVYKYTNVFTTDTNGQRTIDGLEWGNYYIFVNPNDGHDISGTSKLIPIYIPPDEDVNLEISMSPHNQNSVLIYFVDPSNYQIASVSAKIFDLTGFEATASSGISTDPDFGQAFFTDLEAKIYQLEASASGFLNFSGILDVIGNKSEIIKLNPE
jgi:hypothetical protein